MLECVRDGLPNAEIAVRLGLSVNTVKYHVSNLLAKAGVAERGELREAEFGASRGGLRGILPAVPLWAKLAGSAFAAAAIGVGVAAQFVGTPATARRPVPAGYERPTAVELGARGMTDAGPLFLDDGAVVGIQVRGDLTVVRGTPGAQVVVGTNGSAFR